MDDSGNVYVTGYNSGFFSTCYYATIKYSATAVDQWIKRYNEQNSKDLVNAIAVDGSGNVYVTGCSIGSRWSVHTTIKYNTAGIEQWIVH